MNIHDLELRDPYVSTGLEAYLADIANGFCRYIEPAQSAGVLFFSQYNVNELIELGTGNLAAGLFYTAIVHTEWVRRKRRQLIAAGEAGSAKLMCDNLIVIGSEEYDWRTAKNVVDWPHYLLKALYSRVGLMFGKFWTHEEMESLDGRHIPKPPVTFLSIRNAIKLRDPRLLQEQYEIADVVEQAVDGGENVIADMLGRALDIDSMTTSSIASSSIFDLLKDRLA